MHQQATSSKAASSTAAKSDENKINNQKKKKNFVGIPVTNKFFKPKTVSTPLPLKLIMNKPNNKLQQFVDCEINRTSVIYSEDVSRKKMKLDETCKAKKFYSMSKGSTEDFLENLKKNIDKKMKSQPVLEGETRTRKKPEAKKKTLFNDESLKLMNNFKEYFKDRDNGMNKDDDLQQLATEEASIKPHSNKSNTITNQGNIDSRINASENYDPFVYNQMPLARKFVPNLELQMPTLSNCSTLLIKNDDLISNASELQRSETGLTKILSNISTPVLSFRTGTAIIENRENHPDELTCPTPPQVALSLRYTQQTERENLNTSSQHLSYF